MNADRVTGTLEMRACDPQVIRDMFVTEFIFPNKWWTDAAGYGTGDSISGKEAADIELINFSYPLEELDDKVQQLAEKLTNIPLSQLMCMKLIVNQAYDNMGLQSTQTLGPILDGIMRNTPEGREFVNVSASEGVKTAIQRRDGPFGDYSQAPIEERPRKRSQLK